MKALVIEDAREFVIAVSEVLHRAGFEVLVAENGQDGLALATIEQPDMVIVDLGLPDLDGLDVCARLRSVSDAYIVIVTARTSENDLAAGFAAGADDYVTKPFSAIELHSRIRAVTRRARRDDDTASSMGLVLDPSTRTVSHLDRSVEVTQTEFRILGRLLHEAGGVVTREALAESLWGVRWDGDSHTINVHVSNLRRKLDDLDWPGRVAAIRGIGHRLEDLADAA